MLRSIEINRRALRLYGSPIYWLLRIIAAPAAAIVLVEAKVGLLAAFLLALLVNVAVHLLPELMAKTGKRDHSLLRVDGRALILNLEKTWEFDMDSLTEISVKTAFWPKLKARILVRGGEVEQQIVTAIDYAPMLRTLNTLLPREPGSENNCC